MKKFKLVIELDGDGLRLNGENDGFTALELIALLDIKKTDIIKQFTKQENFTHHRVVKTDGELEEIREKE